MLLYTHHIHCQDNGRQIANFLLSWWKLGQQLKQEPRDKKGEAEGVGWGTERGRVSPSPRKKSQEWLPCPCSHTPKATVEITEGKDEKETVSANQIHASRLSLALGLSHGGLPAMRDELDQYHLLFHPREAPFLLLYIMHHWSFSEYRV